VLGEAIVVGLVASIVGLVTGVGVVVMLKGLLGGLGLALPGSGLVFLPATVWWSLLIGVGMTMISALAPSRRSAAVAPMEAIRAATVERTAMSFPAPPGQSGPSRCR
jgi:putative ABC transport system permease protein